LAKYCSNCGAKVEGNAKFCNECGTPIFGKGDSKAKGVDGEKVLFALSNARKPKSFGRHDDYCIAVTPQRMIFARVTSEMLKESAKEASEEAKAQGKGFFGRIKSQMGAHFNFGDKYIGKNPQEILVDHEDNFEINNRNIKRIQVRSKTRGEDDDYYEFNIETTSGKYKFEFPSTLPKNYDNLKSIYGGRVQTKGWFKIF
jgi:hypothetical protein